MPISLHAVIPCAAADAALQPREVENPKVSKSRRRKLRDRRVAVRHALRHSAGLKQDLNSRLMLDLPPPPGFDGATAVACRAERPGDGLKALQSCLEEVTPLLQQLLGVLVSQVHCADETAYNMNTVSDMADAVRSHLDPKAPAFEPTAAPKGEPVEHLGTEIVAMPCGESGATRDCSKCLLPGGACICEEVFCRQCIKALHDCNCQSPVIRRRVCQHCGAREDFSSLFDEDASAISAPLPVTFICHQCNGGAFDAEEFYCVESAKVCGKCLRLGYHDVFWCDGKGCLEARPFHSGCMEKVGNSHFCQSCVQVGNVAESDGTDSDSAASVCFAPTDTRGSDNEPSFKHKLGEIPSESEPSWNDEEVKIWVRVTMRLAARLPTQKARVQSIHDRWKEARSRIPQSHVTDMETLISEIIETIKDWPDGVQE